MREPTSGESAIGAALRLVKERYGRMAAISAALLVPCYWHARIEAGDLASHIYNAWLSQLIERGQAPGLYIANRWDNVLFDVVLMKLAGVVGLGWAEKIAVSACVLIFFWGAFAFMSAAARRAPWFLVPGIAMVAYGWTFHMGFMNYYVSLGFAFAGAALFWRGREVDWIVGIALAALAFVAHPLGLVWLVGIVMYVKIAAALRGAWRWLLTAAAFVAILGARTFVMHRFRTGPTEMAHFYFYTGADQIILFSPRYLWLAGIVFVLSLATVLFGLLIDRKTTGTRWAFRAPLELWTASVFAAAILPNDIYLPHYGAPAALLVPRLTSTTAVLALSIVACLEPRRRYLVGLALCAAVFFVWVHQDTGTLSRMESQASQLVRGLPRGQRVTASIWFPLREAHGETPASAIDGNSLGISYIGHIVDRACIDHCFSYEDYEPASRQFRIRALPENAMVTTSADDSSLMETGRYVVRPGDLPMAEICQCDAADQTKLCLRELKAGELNGQGCFRPPNR
ncbi:MAG: hypothetical protein WBF06_10950 [Candidatus Acidiferrales bacterium]